MTDLIMKYLYEFCSFLVNQPDLSVVLFIPSITIIKDEDAGGTERWCQEHLMQHPKDECSSILKETSFSRDCLNENNVIAQIA